MVSMAKDISRSHCPIGNLLDIVGDRWTLLVVRDLMFFGKHEYKEFIASPESIATNILSDRLKRLQIAGVIDEISHPISKTRKLYYLTAQGKALLPILVEMLIWSHKNLPDVEIMKPVYRRIRSNPEAFKQDVLSKLDEWEQPTCLKFTLTAFLLV